MGVTFTASQSALTPNFVKLQQKSKSGSRVVVDVVIGGPTTSQDIYSFAFDIKIGDPSIVQFVAGSGKAGDVLTASAGQTIVAQAAAQTGDPSDIICGVTKTGGGQGNGVSGASAVVLELTFAAKKVGSTSLTITGSQVKPPTALDSNGVPIGSITFDTAAAGVQGISS